MRKLTKLSAALLMAFALVLPAMAGEGEAVTLDGELQCARCTRQEKDLEACQNVLVVKEDGKESLYYLAGNEANHEYGDVCMDSRRVRVTGLVEEKDGRKWIAASEIVDVKKG